jgi:hypothetical protein
MMPTLLDDCWGEVKGFLLFEKDERRETLHGAAMKDMIKDITTQTIFNKYEREEIITFTNEGPVAGAAVPAFTRTGYDMMMDGCVTDYAEVYEYDYGTGREITLLFNNRRTDQQDGHAFYSHYIMHTARLQVKNLDLYAALRALAIERYGEEQVEYVEETYYAVAIDAEASTLIEAFEAIEAKCKEDPLGAHVKECRQRWLEEGLPQLWPDEPDPAPSVGVAIAAAVVGAVAGAVAGAAAWDYIDELD